MAEPTTERTRAAAPPSSGPLPTFVVAGAPRCGTTSLHYYLRQHPEICMSSIKEPNFFLFGEDGSHQVEEPSIVRKSVRDEADYRHLFHPSAGETAFGEISPLYLYMEHTPARIREMCGPIPIVCLLRSPAERAWSHFLHAVPVDSEDQAAEEFARLVEREMAIGPEYSPYKTSTHLLRLGLYHDQLVRYREQFGPDGVLALLNEDLTADPAATLRTIAEFIGVDGTFPFATDTRYNASGQAPTSTKARIRRVVRKVQPAVKAVLPARIAGRLAEARSKAEGKTLVPFGALDPALHRTINDWCRADIERTAALIDRDLSAWLEVPGA